MSYELCGKAFLRFLSNKVTFKILGALSKDTHRDICNYSGIWLKEENIFLVRVNSFRCTYIVRRNYTERFLS